MLRSLKEIKGYGLSARDGDIGRCHDFLIDDQHLTVRYMVADTQRFLPGRRVLISPASLGEPDWESRRFPLDLDKEQIKGSPPLESDAPVTRLYERKWFEYYGWPIYWGGPMAWGPVPLPRELTTAASSTVERERTGEEGGSQLRSMSELVGYDVGALDGSVGVVDDFIADDESWALRYLVVDTRKWLPARRVLFSIQWLESVDWIARKAQVGLTIDQVKGAPDFDPAAPINRELETRTYDYYGRPMP